MTCLVFLHDLLKSSLFQGSQLSPCYSRHLLVQGLSGSAPGSYAPAVGSGDKDNFIQALLCLHSFVASQNLPPISIYCLLPLMVFSYPLPHFHGSPEQTRKQMCLTQSLQCSHHGINHALHVLAGHWRAEGGSNRMS